MQASQLLHITFTDICCAVGWILMRATNVNQKRLQKFKQTLKLQTGITSSITAALPTPPGNKFKAFTLNKYSP